MHEHNILVHFVNTPKKYQITSNRKTENDFKFKNNSVKTTRAHRAATAYEATACAHHVAITYNARHVVFLVG